MFYMHVHGHGSPAELARKVKPALDLIGKGGNRPAAAAVSAAPSASALDTVEDRSDVGAPGEQSGAVYKITVGRDDLKLTEMGAPINARMASTRGRRSSAPNENAAVAGDIAMLRTS